MADTVEKKNLAARCRVAGSTAFRWRHASARAVDVGRDQLRVVEADRRFVLSSRLKVKRKPRSQGRKRGGQGGQNGDLSHEQVRFLVLGRRPHRRHVGHIAQRVRVIASGFEQVP